VKYDIFVSLVQRLAELRSDESAETIIRATLETLSERLSIGQAEHLAAQLPREVAEVMKIEPERHGEAFTLEEFFKRVSRRADENINEIVHQVRAVTEVVTEAVSPNELDELFAQLPYEFQQLFYAGPGRNNSQSEL
jgi:uncharacterized protein (DUF2267 family)